MRGYLLRCSIGLVLALVPIGCGTASKASPYVKLSSKEKARQALDEEDFGAAIQYYTEYRGEDPDDIEILPLLAAAYAGSAGFDIVRAAKANIEAKGSSSLLETLRLFLPANPSNEQITAILLAKETILDLPADHRDRDHPEIPYASGAALQLELYQAAYAVMYLNQFTQFSAEGVLNSSKLEEMSPADADVILNNLEQIAAQSNSGIPAGAGQIVAQVDAQPGDTRRDKLIKYLNPNS